MYEFKLPDLGEGIHEGEILKWYVQADHTIQADDPLVDVETDKAAVTIPSPKGGRVVAITGGHRPERQGRDDHRGDRRWCRCDCNSAA
ncbi:MAG: biotin/lipoyl-containing protein [Planctomycetota bacterium]